MTVVRSAMPPTKVEAVEEARFMMKKTLVFFSALLLVGCASTGTEFWTTTQGSTDIAYGTVEAVEQIPIEKAEDFAGRSAKSIAGGAVDRAMSNFKRSESLTFVAVEGVHGYESVKHAKRNTPYLTINVKGKTLRYPVVPSAYPKGHLPYGFTVGERVKLVYRKAWKAMRIYPAPTGCAAHRPWR